METNIEVRKETGAEVYRKALLRNKELFEITTVAKRIKRDRSHLSSILNGSKNLTQATKKKLDEYFKNCTISVP